MKRFAAILCAVLLFTTAFAGGGAPEEERPRWADSLRSVYLYTEAIKQSAIYDNKERARELLYEVIATDSSFAPAFYELAAQRLMRTPEEASRLAQRAYQLDTSNKWYLIQYGQTLLLEDRYAEALPLYQRLFEIDKEPNNYRLLAALYDQLGQPYSAITVLDSAEVRFGRIPLLSRMKRQLLVTTNQTERAIKEAQQLVEEVPYEAENHSQLAELYGRNGQDSLALISFNKALEIDSLNLEALMSLSDFYNSRRNYREMLRTTRKLFAHKAMPIETKIRQFEICTSDIDFYRDNYFQIDDLASLLSIHHPTDPRVVKLYANHLIASGELERALEHYKLHAEDTPLQESYLLSIIDIESYLQRPDSVEHYVQRALELFPEKAELHMAGGNVLYRQKRYKAAIEAYQRSLEFAPSDSLRSVIWGQIGDVYHQQLDEELVRPSKAKKLRKQSYAAYEKALAYNPDNILVLNNWAYFLSLEEVSLEQALQMAGRVLELTDNNPTYMDTYAWVLFKLGRLEEARKIQQRAVALDGQKSLELLVHYGDILFAEGKRFMAETYWKRALDKGYDKTEIERRLAQPDPERPKPIDEKQ